MVMRLSHLSNYTDMVTSLYWIDPAVLVIIVLEDILAPNSGNSNSVCWEYNFKVFSLLNHWGCICISKLTSISSDNGFLPGQRQAVVWTNAGILLIRALGTNFDEILSEIDAFSFKKMHVKIVICRMASVLSRP